MKRFVGSKIIHLFSPNINVCYGVGINRSFTTEVIRAAIDATIIRHPMLLYTVKADDAGEWFYDDDGMVEIQFLDNNISLSEWYVKNDSIPFDFNRCLVKIVVFIGDNNTDIMLLGHHILGDGLGFLNVIKDLLTAIDGKLTDEILVVPENNFIKNIGSDGFLMELFAKSLNKKWRKSKTQFSYNEYVELFNNYRNSNPPSIYLDNILSVDKIHTACKKIGITVNEAFYQAFVCALNKFGITKTKFGCAASIRNEMQYDVSNTMGNYTTGIMAVIPSPKDAPQKLRDKLRNPKYRYQIIQLLNLIDRSLIAAVPFAIYDNYNNKTVNRLGATIGEKNENKSFGITNLGVQQFGDYSFNVNIQFICPVFPQNFLTVGIITVNNIAQFTLRYSEKDLTEKQVADLFSDVKDYLDSFVR